MNHLACGRMTGGYSVLTLVLAAMCCGACGEEQPVKPQNRAPSISSLTASPDTLGMLDSATVTCLASDPDGDTLVYDWVTDDRVGIRGARPGDPFLYNTIADSIVMYP